MTWVQAEADLYIQTMSDNLSKIEKQRVFLAEIDECVTGLCVAAIGRYAPDYVFIQRVAVVTPARKRGAGLALMRATAESEPAHNIAGATLPDDHAAHALNAKLARSLESKVKEVPRRRFTPTDLGVGRNERHRPWTIDRPST
ncbi:GNAT family N-acetyltransferase [Microbacterium oleivorans]|uniref:GNAT family N-acetyltransferase n=1 Tax=Microbacterium oleivorans TaxID=273677 RepID=A0A7D5IX72_9MICO|nr:GNAT family N-acetyltransferase [Microbacterium oleivorans]QLD11476.1 GNAT family N-acetyltransferase [Microbacterium oleivorans]